MDWKDEAARWKVAFALLANSCIDHFGHLPGDYDHIKADAESGEAVPQTPTLEQVMAVPTRASLNAQIPSTELIFRDDVLKLYRPSGARGVEGASSPKPEIICLCGSSRFIDVAAVLAWELEKDGKIVVMMHLLPA
jgi:hypothetical protein